MIDDSNPEDLNNLKKLDAPPYKREVSPCEDEEYELLSVLEELRRGLQIKESPHNLAKTVRPK